MHLRKASFISVATLIVFLAGCNLSHHSVLTQHNNSMRTGTYLLETELTPAAVDTASGPGKALRYWPPVDGNLTAQLLYARGVTIGLNLLRYIYSSTQHTIHSPSN